jgi:AbrB family looped-hinge helix DNA binding protein
MAEATLSSKNQVVIPKEVRDAIGVKAGDKLIIVVQDGCAIIMRRPKSIAKALHGSMRDVYPEDYLRKERESWDKRA